MEGVNAWCSGQNFETPAEIRPLKILSALGMSTVPEVVLARFPGMKASAISVITGTAGGLWNEHISHERTKAGTSIGAKKLEKLIRGFLHGYRAGLKWRLWRRQEKWKDEGYIQ